jgi:glutamate synthase (NADPH/NADH) small chain
LNLAGHTVTVFERDEKPGGLLRYGIPDFKLEKWVIDRRVEIMEKEGVEFNCNTDIGTDVTMNELLRNFNSIILATGSTIPRDLPVKGRDIKGIHFAMQFLKQQNKRVDKPGADLLKERHFPGTEWNDQILATLQKRDS